MTEDEARPPRPGVPPAGEIAQYIDDRWTKLFVAAVIVVFALIFANAFFLGQGGLLTTTPSPTPAPTASPTVEPTASPPPSATAPPTPTAPATASPSAVASLTPSPTTSATETPSP